MLDIIDLSLNYLSNFSRGVTFSARLSGTGGGLNFGNSLPEDSSTIYISFKLFMKRAPKKVKVVDRPAYLPDYVSVSTLLTPENSS